MITMTKTHYNVELNKEGVHRSVHSTAAALYAVRCICGIELRGIVHHKQRQIIIRRVDHSF